MTKATLWIAAVWIAGCGNVPGDGLQDAGHGDGRFGDAKGRLDGVMSSGDAGGGTGTGIYRDGTRLKWQKVSSSDGLGAYYQLYDTQFAQVCTLLTSNDDQLRCLPYGQAYVADMFADASCTVPVAYASCDVTNPGYAISYDKGQYTTFPILSSYTGSVYSGSPSSCNPTSLPSYEFFRIGTAIAPSEFVTAVKHTPGAMPASGDLSQNGSRIAPESVTTDDGAAGSWFIDYDSQLATECYLSVAGDGQLRCLPSTMAYDTGSYFGDANCVSPILATTLTQTVQYADSFDSHQCPMDYYHVDSPFSGTPYQRVNGTCIPAPTDGVYQYYYKTPISVTTFAAGTPSTADGPFTGFQSGSRLKLKTVSTSDGARTLYSYYDAQLSIDCYGQAAEDGTKRCMPEFASAMIDYYADASCTEQLANVGCDVGSYAYSISSCGAMSYYQLGTAFSGTTYALVGGSCTVVDAPSSYSLYRVGAPVPDTAFALIELSTP